MLGLLLAVAPSTEAANRTQAGLLLDHEVAAPGSVIRAGVRLKMAPQWHTYWKNPGDSGMATEIQWELPAGVTAGEIQWPVPEKYEFEGFYTHVYHDEVVLLVPLTVGADVAPGPTEVRAKVKWLECHEVCIPGSAQISSPLVIAREARASTNAPVLAEWERRLPVESESFKVTASWENEADGDSRSMIVEAGFTSGTGVEDFLPYLEAGHEISAPTEVIAKTDTSLRLRKKVLRFGDAGWPDQFSGIFLGAKGSRPAAYEFVAAIGGQPLPTTTAAETAGAAAPLISFWQMLLYAFIGGLILNIMPCVLPVIALKILGFVQQSKEAPARVRRLGLIYGVGVLCSFLALAALVIGVRLAGQAAGWGMQFKSPQFLVAMTVLVMLVALNLFGVFEVNAGSGVMNTAGRLSGREGASGAFFNGVLATVLATPCTAPFLAPALGFALNNQQPLWMVVLFFLTIGAGLAFPYVLLSFQPAWLKFLPKPGPWMERFKQLMGFPMLATAFWLYTLAAPRFGDNGTLWLGLFLVLIGMSVWIWGEFVQRGRTGRMAGRFVAVAVAAVAYLLALETKLHWRDPQVARADSGEEVVIDGIRWLRWSPEVIARVQDEGRPVVVDFTADWCLTCHTVVKPAIESDAVQARVKDLNAALVIADYTDYPERMTLELQRFNRAGVPMVLVYPGRPGAEPEVIPDSIVFTTFKASLLEALGRVGPDT